MPSAFDADTAFSRNLGWLTPAEQASLRRKRIAIAGLGGAGGVHLLTLVRLGIGAFHLADLDSFEYVNFNRQVGATVSTVGHPKVDVLAALARDINPALDLRLFPEGVNAGNLNDFLDGVDLYVDGLDYFAFAARRQVYAACCSRGIPITFAVPLGFGAALLNVLPGGMDFERYFCLGEDESEWPLRFLAGISPRLPHQHYLVYPEIIDFQSHRVPSTGIACQICSGMAGTEAVKILLRRGRVRSLPHTAQFDPYLGKLTWSWRPGGNRHPLQRLLIRYLRYRLQKIRSPSALNGPQGSAR